jgi:hypothetical protein
VTVAHRALDGLDEMRRRVEPERHRVADVEVPDTDALRLDRSCLRHDLANGVGEAVHPRGNRDRLGGCAVGSHRPNLTGSGSLFGFLVRIN